MKKTSLLLALALAAFAAGSSSAAPAPPRSGIDRHVLALALAAAEQAEADVAVPKPNLLTIIDYSLPSTTPRLWVLDRGTGEVLRRELVAHGSGTGENYATAFSNLEGSRQSSLGLFLTEETYVGRNGYSLRLKGLEPGFNDHARERAIVIHGAPYVSAQFARAHGRLGRSWGCPALPEEVAHDVIDEIQGGSLVFAYYPDTSWLTNSRFLASERGTVVAAAGR